jgi:AraC-like DNA-binding protein
MELTSTLPIKIGQPGVYRCEPTWRWKPAPLRDFDLWIVLAGRGTLSCGGGTHVLRAGAGFVFQPGDRIEAAHDPKNPLVVFVCHFLRAGPFRKTARFLQTFLSYEVSDIDYAGRCAEQATHVYEQGAAGRQLAAALVGQLVAQALLLGERRNAVHPADEKLAALALEIRSRPGADWDAPSMAHRCALSTPQFNRRFKRAFGLSSRQYVLRERIGRAATLLRETELSIKEIAEALGYRDVFYFHRQFRQLLGQTPREIRLSSRADFQRDRSHSKKIRKMRAN